MLDNDTFMRSDKTAFELDAEGAASFWTPERRRLARPIDPTRLAPIESDSTHAFTPSAAGPATPSPLSNAQRVADPRDNRWRQLVVLYTVIDGEPYQASGVVVGPNLVLTAGHALSLPPHDATTALAIPAFDRGIVPFGQWSGERFYAPNQWTSDAAVPFDVALVQIAPTSDGHTIGATVGIRRVAASSNAPPAGFSRAWTGAGYPGSPGGGESMYAESLAVSLVRDRRINREGDTAFVVGAASDFSTGCSGGPWLTNLGGQTVVNGLYSRIDRTIRGIQFGPYFGPELKSWLSDHLSVLNMPDT